MICRVTIPEAPDPLRLPNAQLAPAGNPLQENVIELLAKPETANTAFTEAPGEAIESAVGFAERAGATTVNERLADAVAGVPSESDTCTVKLYVPACVGVPEIIPVVAASERPGARLPELMLHV